jgi:hypothetical protein
MKGLIAAATCAIGSFFSSASDLPTYELPPINYSSSTPTDPVQKLKEKLDANAKQLSHETERGYLKAFLAELDIPVSSQVLVFSKTSLQRQKIWPRTPRAIYFNDEVYVGWVRGGDVLEVSAADPQLGGTFYTLAQKPEAKPVLSRQTHNCLQCHDSNGMTLGVPGHMIRSVFPDDEGMPRYNMGTFRTNDRSPFSERWGGWYVSGEAGSLRHMGNVIYPDEKEPDMKLFGELGANKTDLRKLAALDAYLTDTSDIVALMVLEHQAYVHNLLTRANHETRIAVRQSNDINKMTNTPPEKLTDGCISRIKSNCDALIEALLFCEEAKLNDPVKGNSSFATDFEKRGPFDAQGRSLRHFDLKTRMFKFPCSYLVYSKSFSGLPKEARDYLSKRMYEILSSAEPVKGFEHLSAQDRKNVFDILRATLPDFTRDWK